MASDLPLGSFEEDSVSPRCSLKEKEIKFTGQITNLCSCVPVLSLLRDVDTRTPGDIVMTIMTTIRNSLAAYVIPVLPRQVNLGPKFPRRPVNDGYSVMDGCISVLIPIPRATIGS